MDLETWPKGRLQELSVAECWRMLGEHRVGRLAWCGPTGPHLVPVNYLELDHCLWIRTSPYSQLAREAREGPVVFEVDDIDDFTRSGASVLVDGVAEHRVPDHRGPLATDLEPWPEGQRTMVLAVEVRTITGRRLLPS